MSGGWFVFWLIASTVLGFGVFVAWVAFRGRPPMPPGFLEPVAPVVKLALTAEELHALVDVAKHLDMADDDSVALAIRVAYRIEPESGVHA